MLAILAATACTSNPSSTTDPQLQQVLDRRFLGDRTGACVAAAVIDQSVHRAVVCANPEKHRARDGSSAFEIPQGMIFSAPLWHQTPGDLDASP